MNNYCVTGLGCRVAVALRIFGDRSSGGGNGTPEMRDGARKIQGRFSALLPRDRGQERKPQRYLPLFWWCCFARSKTGGPLVTRRRVTQTRVRIDGQVSYSSSNGCLRSIPCSRTAEWH